jgi:hypothetical protein
LSIAEAEQGAPDILQRIGDMFERVEYFHQRSEDKLNTSTLQPIFPNNCKIGEYPRPTYFMMLQKMHETKHRPNWFVYSECVTSKLL